MKGINGPLLQWIHEFLKSRYQQVRIQNDLSRLCHLKSDIWQGSVLGLLLFLILIEDLGIELDPKMAKILKYVNDSKIIGLTKCEDDVIELQKVLDNIYE